MAFPSRESAALGALNMPVLAFGAMARTGLGYGRTKKMAVDTGVGNAGRLATAFSSCGII